jgi:S-adenosylmethionine:tRNA ribosyltransferase-isomerase
MENNLLLLDSYDFELSEELIAQEPVPQRQGSRMLHVDRETDSFSDSVFSSLPSLLKNGDVLVLNNTKVFPARLIGRSETGAKIEIFLVENIRKTLWTALAKPARRLKTGKRIFFSDELSGIVTNIEEGGRVTIELESVSDVDEAIENIGLTPLPPYIKREEEKREADRERYQTVFAKERGAIAAPTAGLHFTDEILGEIKSRGVTIAEITLHVGYGTFAPVRADNLSDHTVASEKCEISDETAAILNLAKAEGRRIVAVGTTSTRTLESCTDENGNVLAGRRIADLTITPGYKFRTVGALLTNFHLPMSSLLVLVATFGGHELIMNAYRYAVAERYRFYSYGDCMFIE